MYMQTFIRYKLFVGEPATIEEVTKAVAHFMDGATIYEARGLWKGNTERSIVVEILMEDNHDDLDIRTLALALKHRFNQECVLVTRDEIRAAFI